MVIVRAVRVQSREIEREIEQSREERRGKKRGKGEMFTPRVGSFQSMD